MPEQGLTVIEKYNTEMQSHGNKNFMTPNQTNLSSDSRGYPRAWAVWTVLRRRWATSGLVAPSWCTAVTPPPSTSAACPCALGSCCHGWTIARSSGHQPQRRHQPLACRSAPAPATHMQVNSIQFSFLFLAADSGSSRCNTNHRLF